jgi:hypothetical protein
MKYYKFNIDEHLQNKVFFSYREITETSKEPLISKVFSLPTIGKEEPRFLELVAGPIIGIYYESRGTTEVREKIYLDRVDTLSDEEVYYIKSAVEKACIENTWDHLSKPTSVDEQVEDFIKQFFSEETQEAPLEQKDFLAEFFAELEQDANDTTN